LALKLPENFAGILGHDLLSRFPMKVDYADEQIIFYHPGKFTPPVDSLSTDFEFFMKIPAININYAGYEGKFLIDLGNSIGLIFHNTFVEKHNLNETFTDVEEMKSSFGGVGGKSQTYAAVGGEFNFGPVELESTPLIVAKSETGLVESTVIDGNIGNLVLKNYSIVLDYSNKKIYILPPE
jgi:hypothetical protein